MNSKFSTCSAYIRITSIQQPSRNKVIVNGVPLDIKSSEVKSGRHYIVIKALRDSFPVVPKTGQHWVVEGKLKIESIDVGDFIMERHLYDSPHRLKCNMPETGEQLIKFIASEPDFRGIGEHKARAIWQAFGKKLYDILCNDTEQSRQQFKGLLSEDSISSLFSGYAKYRNLSHCNWMSENKIPANIQQKLLRFHGELTIHNIKLNPYILVGFGMSFDEVDEIATDNDLSFKVPICDDRRLSAAVEVSIRKEIEKGHTYALKADLVPSVLNLLKCEELTRLAFKAGHSKAQFVLNPTTFFYHPTAQLLMENVVAKRLSYLAKQEDFFDEKARVAYLSTIQELPYKLTNRQLVAVKVCLSNGVSCITGGAGTGKTTVLYTVLKSFSKLGYKVHAVALSGRAAMRLHESTGVITSTIAKLLNDKAIEPSSEKQLHVLVIDEASMIDIPLMYQLVNHIHPSVRILFVGDPEQLPPIGCGKVLSDIVHSKTVANTHLDIIKRQKEGSRIPEYSMSINQGDIPQNLTDGSVYFHQASKNEIAEVCCELYQCSPESSQVLAPTNKLVHLINQLIQSAVNADSRRLEFELYGERYYQNLSLGDVVLFTQNHYKKGIQNGSLGKLTSIQTSGDKLGEVTLDSGDIVGINQSLLDCMELGYAITLHKAQGSQFRRVIIALNKSKIVDRSWLYTAITRAETEVHIVGEEADFKAVIKAPSYSHRRNSYLSTLLLS